MDSDKYRLISSIRKAAQAMQNKALSPEERLEDAATWLLEAAWIIEISKWGNLA